MMLIWIVVGYQIFCLSINFIEVFVIDRKKSMAKKKSNIIIYTQALILGAFMTLYFLLSRQHAFLANIFLVSILINCIVAIVYALVIRKIVPKE